MSCGSCGTNGTSDAPAGCGSKGSCSSGCNRKSTFDWFADTPLSYTDANFDIVEISFKNGARKDYFRNSLNLDLTNGDKVAVETGRGFDVGVVSLKGVLVKLQLKKYRVNPEKHELARILRLAKPEDIEQQTTARGLEQETLGEARRIARELNLDMKLGDIEYQADCKKATFFYTADARVDFRELVKRYAQEFKIKVEMRQIGPRQEAGRIGGIGDCGRELCCSTWLSNFDSVSTNAARYQNLSINTDKLSGQCGRLKCCLNFELDTYLDALKGFPKQADRIETKEGIARLRKKDIFKKVMWYGYRDSSMIYKLDVSAVKKLVEMNKKGQKPASLTDFVVIEAVAEEDKMEDLVGQISLSTLEKKQKKKRKRNPRRKKGPRK